MLEMPETLLLYIMLLQLGYWTLIASLKTIVLVRGWNNENQLVLDVYAYNII